MRPADRSRLGSLAEKTDQWFRRANAFLLNQVPCRAGCSQCCIGVFPITRLDAGEVGYVASGLKSIAEARVGDTLTDADNAASFTVTNNTATSASVIRYPR